MKLFWAIVIAIIVAGCKSSAPQTAKDKVTVQTVENDIRANVPIGSSRADVIAFLDQRRIPHGLAQGGEVLPDGRFVVTDEHLERGIIRNVRTEGHLFKIYVSIQLDFKLDDNDSKLLNYSVREVYEGP